MSYLKCMPDDFIWHTFLNLIKVKTNHNAEKVVTDFTVLSFYYRLVHVVPLLVVYVPGVPLFLSVA